MFLWTSTTFCPKFRKRTPWTSDLTRLSSIDENSFSRKGWTYENQIQLVLTQSRFGNQWSKMMKLFPVKNSNSLKNQFFSITRRCIRKICRKINEHEYLSKISTLKSTTLSQFFAILYQKGKQWNTEESQEDVILSIMDLAFFRRDSAQSNSLIAKKIFKDTIATLMIAEWAD
jgi:hypothetical protein